MKLLLVAVAACVAGFALWAILRGRVVSSPATTDTPRDDDYTIDGHVFIFGQGIGRITAIEDKEPDGKSGRTLVIALEDGRRMTIPFRSASQVLRPPVPRDAADAVLALMRRSPAQPDERPWPARYDEFEAVAVRGNLDEEVRTLLKAYSKGSSPSIGEYRVIQTLEDLVTAELSTVLRLERAALAQEFAQRYPRTRPSPPISTP